MNIQFVLEVSIKSSPFKENRRTKAHSYVVNQ